MQSDKIRKVKDVKFEYVKDHDLSECAGVFGFKMSDFPKVLNWAEALQKYYEDKLRRAEQR